jgi:probable rRNA maturation factor
MATPDPRAPRILVGCEAGLPGLDAEALAGAVARTWLRHWGPPGATLELSLLDQAAHTRLHAELLGDPEPTDVMAIAYRDADLWGEILINADCARREAAARGTAPHAEALLYALHGTLHLLGFDDRGDAARAAMRAAERAALAREKCPARA